MDNDYKVPAGQWISANERFRAPKKIDLSPQIDELVSRVVGFKVFLNDPRLIQTIVKWKKQANRPDTYLEPDNYLNDPKKVEELKRVLK